MRAALAGSLALTAQVVNGRSEVRDVAKHSSKELHRHFKEQVLDGLFDNIDGKESKRNKIKEARLECEDPEGFQQGDGCCVTLHHSLLHHSLLPTKELAALIAFKKCNKKVAKLIGEFAASTNNVFYGKVRVSKKQKKILHSRQPHSPANALTQVKFTQVRHVSKTCQIL
eukprot:gene430-902_t